MKKYQAYALSLAAVTTGFVAWGQGLRWHFDHLSNYRLFPLFGLMAYGLLWSMYMVNFIRSRLGKGENFKRYFYPVRAAVLVFILLHPSILIWQLWRDGFGLPPGSYLQHYVAPSLKWAAILSTVSLFVFLAYEFKFKFGKTWWWTWLESVGDLAMIGIFIHGLELGTQIRHGWFRSVWYFYGLTLGLALINRYALKLARAQPSGA